MAVERSLWRGFEKDLFWMLVGTMKKQKEGTAMGRVRMRLDVVAMGLDGVRRIDERRHYRPRVESVQASTSRAAS